MGRLRYILPACLLVIVSCVKEADMPEQNNSSQGEEVRPDNPESGAGDVELITVSFAAAIEEVDKLKTTIDETGMVQWTEGDVVRVWWADSGSAVMTALESGQKTVFSDVSVGVADCYYSAYPDAGQSLDMASESMNLTIPDAQDGSFASANHIVGRTLPGEKTLYFYYASSVVKFNISRPDITAVTLRSADGSAIAGNVSVDFSDVTGASDIPSFSVTDGSDEIKVSVSGPGTYYVAILPEKAIAGGLLFRAETAEDYLPAAATGRNQASFRGKIKNYVIDGGMDSRIVSDYYVSATGSGNRNGKSAENAFDSESFAAFVGSYASDAEMSRSQAFRLYGTTVHVEGEVTVPDVIDISFAADAYEKPVAFTMEGGVLSGGTASAIFSVGERSCLELSQMTLSGGNAGGDNGGALSVNSASARVNASECVFSGNTAYDGGAVSVAAGVLAATKCTFMQNSSQKCGGAISAEGAGASVFLNKCSLNGNSSGDWGMSVNIGSGAVFATNGSVFYGNVSSGNNDASLNLKGSSLICNSTFVEDVDVQAVIHFSGSASSCFANSIVVGRDESDMAVYMDGTSHKLASHGGSLIGRVSGASLAAVQTFTKNMSDIYNFKYKEFDSPSWDISSRVFSWSNGSICGYNPVRPTSVSAAVATFGSDYLKWLTDVDEHAFTKDISGYSRPEDGMRPGAWEGSAGMSSSSDKLSVNHLLGYYQWTNSSSGVLVMAHRCHISSDNQTENSISAAKQALAAGADILEVDPRPTQDGAIVLCHDKSIENIVNNSFLFFGCDNVNEMTLSKVQSYQLVNRKWFGESARSRYGTGEKIPTLAEFLSGVGAPRTWYVSLDCEKFISENPTEYMTILHTIADIVNSAGMMEHTFFYVSKGGAVAGEDKMTGIRNAFAEWGYPDAAIEFYPYGNSPATDSNYKWMCNFPQNPYSARVTYSPGASPHNLLHVVKDGAVGVVNMLNILNPSIPEYSLDSAQLDELLTNFPYCHIIQTDCPAEIVAALSAKGLRISRYEDKFDAGSGFDGYDTGNYNW